MHVCTVVRRVRLVHLACRSQVGLPSTADGGDAGLEWVPANAEALPFDDASVDGYTVAFGIRNVTHMDRALAEAHRVGTA